MSNNTLRHGCYGRSVVTLGFDPTKLQTRLECSTIQVYISYFQSLHLLAWFGWFTILRQFLILFTIF
jgi:hypothetical protein